MASHEKLRHNDLDIIYSVDQLPSSVTFSELEATYGGKAAGLLYVKRHRPDIPQARMIVAAPGVDSKIIASMAKEQGLQLPWLIRASTPVDNLPGFENVFYTCEYEGNNGTVNADVIDDIEDVKYTKLRRLPASIPFSEASVIIAEKSQSNRTGTLVGHPHRRGIKLAAFTVDTWPTDPKAFYYIEDGNAHFWQLWSKLFNDDDNTDDVETDIEHIARWYDDIASLEGFDQNTTNQLEFGLNPRQLYQVRPFIPSTQADFSIDVPMAAHQERNPIVFGVTPKEGISVTVFHYDEESDKESRYTHPVSFYQPSPELQAGYPLAVFCSSGDTPHIHFRPSVVVLHSPLGVLTHDDIRMMRTSDLTIIFPFDGPSVSSGERLNIKSDGVHVQITKL